MQDYGHIIKHRWKYTGIYALIGLGHISLLLQTHTYISVCFHIYIIIAACCSTGKLQKMCINGIDLNRHSFQLSYNIHACLSILFTKHDVKLCSTCTFSQQMNFSLSYTNILPDMYKGKHELHMVCLNNVTVVNIIKIFWVLKHTACRKLSLFF